MGYEAPAGEPASAPYPPASSKEVQSEANKPTALGEINCRFDGDLVIIEREGRTVRLPIWELAEEWGLEKYIELARRLGYDVSTEEGRKAAWLKLKEWRKLVLEEQPGRLLRMVHRFSRIAPLYSRVEKILLGKELVKRHVKYRLYLAETGDGALFIIYDDGGFVRPRRLSYSLERLERSEILGILEHLPKKALFKALKALEQSEKPPEKPKGNERQWLEQVAALMEKHCVFVKPIPSLRDPKALEGISWREYVEEALTAGASVDPNLLKVREAHALRGIDMRYNPHAIIVTNSGTGKTAFYQAWGVLIDKATPNSLVGYARGEEEVYYGALHCVDEPFAIDQMESAAQASTIRYLFNLMDTGSAVVESGGMHIENESRAIVAFLANPLSTATNPEKGAQWILETISTNPACGRRFGIILYFNNLLPVKSGATNITLEEWGERYVRLVRAVEDFAREELRKIWSHPKTGEWLDREIPGYRERVLELADKAKEDYICSFLRSHAEAQRRIRAAALRIALLYNLDKVALKKYVLDGILAEAEEHLKAIVQINLASIANMLEEVESREEASVLAYYKSLKEYMRVIVNSIEAYKRDILAQYNGNVPQEIKSRPITLESGQVPLYASGSYYHLSKALDRLFRVKPSLQSYYVEILDKRFGIKLRISESSGKKRVEAIITDWRPLPIDLESGLEGE